MAEIEPAAGATESPVETVHVDPPVTTGGPLAAAPRPARPAGLLRWGVALLTLAVMVGVVSVAIALMAAGTAASAVQGWLPRDTVAYVEIRADLPGDQRSKLGDIIAKFPGFADQASLDAKIDEALERLLEGSGASWRKDIKPWLGGEVGVAITAAALVQASVPSLEAGDLSVLGLGKAPDDGAVLLVAVKDANAARAWVSKELAGTQTTETDAGGEITIVSGLSMGDLAFAVRGSVLVLGPEKTVKDALATAGASSVAANASFGAARKAAPSTYLAFGYVDVKTFVDAAMGAAGNAADLPTPCVDQALAAIPTWAAGSVRAEDDALVFAAVGPAPGAASTTKASASSVAAHLPASALAAIEVRDLGTGLVSGLATLKEQLACDASTAGIVGELEKALAGLGGAEDLVGWAGDAAIAVTADGSTFGGGLAAMATDEDAAKRALDQIQALLAFGGASAGISSREETHAGATLLVVAIPAGVGMEVPEIAATLHDGVFAIGTIDFVKAVVDTTAGSSLAKDAVYERAISQAGGDGVVDLFVDIGAIRTAMEAGLPASARAAYETEVKPFLVPFEALAMVAEAPGATTESRAVITFTK